MEQLAELDHRLPDGEVGGVLNDRVAGAQVAKVLEEAVPAEVMGGGRQRIARRIARRELRTSSCAPSRAAAYAVQSAREHAKC